MQYFKIDKTSNNYLWTVLVPVHRKIYKKSPYSTVITQ